MRRKDKTFSALQKKTSPKGFSFQQGFCVTLTLMTLSSLLFQNNGTLKYKEMTSKSEHSNHSNNQ